MRGRRLGDHVRPVLAALDDEQAADFLAEYGEKVRAAYPPSAFGTMFPFRRVFAVAHRPNLNEFSYCFNRESLAGSRHVPWHAVPVSVRLPVPGGLSV
jgi:hypothetical protein